MYLRLGGVKTACKDPSFAQSLIIFANETWQLPEWPFQTLAYIFHKLPLQIQTIESALQYKIVPIQYLLRSLKWYTYWMIFSIMVKYQVGFKVCYLLLYQTFSYLHDMIIPIYIALVVLTFYLPWTWEVYMMYGVHSSSRLGCCDIFFMFTTLSFKLFRPNQSRVPITVVIS